VRAEAKFEGWATSGPLFEDDGQWVKVSAMRDETEIAVINHGGDEREAWWQLAELLGIDPERC